MVKKGLRKGMSIHVVLSLFVMVVVCMILSDQVYADGVVQGHEEILHPHFDDNGGLTSQEIHDYIPIQYTVDYNYTEAYKMVDMVNQLRVSVGRQPLIATDYLMRIGMDRACQNRVYTSHTTILPNFPYSSCDSSLVYPYYMPSTSSLFPDYVPTPTAINYGENLTTCSAENGTLGDVGEAYDAYDSFVNSSAHYQNLIKSSYKYIGIGIVNDMCVIVFYDSGIENSPTFDPNGEYGKLGNGSGEYTGYTPRKIAKRNFINYVVFSTNNSNYIYADKPAAMIYPEPSTTIGKLGYTDKKTNKQVRDLLYIGDSLTLDSVNAPYIFLSQFTLTSSDTSVIEVNGQTATAKKAGTATISVYYTAAPDVVRSATITVKAKDEDKKDKDEKSKVTVDLIYSKAVIDKETKTAEFTGLNKKYTKNLAGYTMPNTISYNGKSYKVTSIGNNAFKNCKNLKKITIPKNIKTIGSNAFRGCSKLQTITVQSTKITKVGKNAFKGIKKNAKIKVPKKKLAAYKKLMKGKGQKVKVVKK